MSVIKDTEKFRFLVTRVNEVLSEQIIDKVPKSGKFQPFSVFYNIPGTQNRGRLVVEPSLTGEDNFRRLRMDVFRTGTDRNYSNYLLHGTNSDIIQYLSDVGNVDTLMEHYASLSESVDEYWD